MKKKDVEPSILELDEEQSIKIGVNSDFKCDIHKYSANYANTNHNFVIQNLDGTVAKNLEYYSAICIVKNILQRGKPTLLSRFLQHKIGSIHKMDNFNKQQVLISQELNNWQRLIKGCDDSTFNPAKKFFDETLEKLLPEECHFIKNLIIPEVLINDITQENKKDFKNQAVDFYLPQAYLVIEIDGSQHKTSEQSSLDKKRDEYLISKGQKVIRIPVQDLLDNNLEKLKDLRDYIIQHKILTLYKNSFINGIDLNKPFIQATTIMRYQILILELLKYNRLSLNKDLWEFELDTNNENSAELLKLAIHDLFIWFACILKLQGILFKKPDIIIKTVENRNFTQKNNLKIDFSLLKRFSDENQLYPNVIFVRNDYFDTYKYFAKTDSSKDVKPKIKQIDYFSVEIANLVKYRFNNNNKNICDKILRYLMWNIFLQNDSTLEYNTTDFREGQLEIIKNVLQRNDTIGLLPTGSGKSICYQLAGILQPAPSIVIAPIISLMLDQVNELNAYYFSRVETINSTIEDKFKVLEDFRQGKYIFILISPERFQNEEFRAKLKTLKHIAYAVVDEAHCLSEWGHDFRTSYLTLINTIRNNCSKEISFLALTATASLYVLKDLKLAFSITNDFNIKTPINYAREELEFYVIDAQKNMQSILNNKIKSINNVNLEKNAILIFTPYTTTNRYGCEGVCNNLQKEFDDIDIRYFHGKLKDQKKLQIQNDYKDNVFNILVSTKAFGMGVNKSNIGYTFHCGIPSSLEALYQEAGRAGRAKKIFQNKKAKCYILFSKEYNENSLQKMWNLNTPKEELMDICTDFKKLSQDVKRQMFLCREEFRSTDEIVSQIKDVYNNLKESNIIDANKYIYFFKNSEGSSENDIKSVVQKCLYRLFQLGVISDWTIDEKLKLFKTDFVEYPAIEEVRKRCQYQIQKYEPEFILEDDIDDIDKCIRLIVEWSYDRFFGYRRQSLKNIYEACENYLQRLKNGEDESVISKEFKQNIEGYFTVNEASHKLAYLAQKAFSVKDINKIFEVFYVYDNANQKTQVIKPKEGIIELKNILMRLLEEYPDNFALNIVSGLTRFLLDDFDNNDGKVRLENALKKISVNNMNEKVQNGILSKILNISQHSENDDLKCSLAKMLFKYFDKSKYIVFVNKFLNDSYTNYLLTQYLNKQINDISNKLMK